MKRAALFFALLFLIPSVAQAQTLVTREKANEYFANCTAGKSSESFVGNGQNIMCACQAARLTQFFTMEDMAAMGSPDTNVARPAYNKMLTEIYAPCMGEPTRAYHYNSCINSPNTNPQLCSCAADALARHMELRGSDIFKQILAQDPMNADPNATLFNSPEFQQLATQKTMGCLK